MDITTIDKSVLIEAAPETVWNTLFEDHTYRTWANEFSEGSFFEGTWEEGSEMSFMDPSHTGLLAIVTTNDPFFLMEVEYLGEIPKKEDGDDEMKGLKETYMLTQEGDGTRLEIVVLMPEKYSQMMSDSWDNALELVKKLAEDTN